MEYRAVRVIVLMLLVGAGVAAALFAWTIEERLGALDQREREIAGRIDPTSSAAVSEAASLRVERTALRHQAWGVIGTVAIAWTFGLLALGRGRHVPPVAVAPDAPPTDHPEPQAVPDIVPQPDAAAIDLTAAAALCTDISRVTTTAALPQLLGRAAALLDARGLIIWMGAGDQLFPAAAYGYDSRAVDRMGPISRGSRNATATAWRTGQVASVAGDPTTIGAIVAPMFKPSYCIGVLAAEVRNGREGDAATRAVTALIAAQLATAVAAWPASSAVDADTAVNL